MNQFILLNPGPVNLSDRVRQALTKPDMCHRESEFSQMMKRTKEKILQLYDLNGTHSVIIITGSGTTSLEAAVSAVDDVLVISNGVYGERISKIASMYDIQRSKLTFEWTVPPDLNLIEKALDSDSKIQTIAVVHHETTTGLLNPIDEIADLAKRFKKRILIDAVSSFGGEMFNANNIDMIVGTANKCIHGVPGLSFLVYKKDMNFKTRNFYLDLNKYLQDNIPFTPAVQTYYALEQALDELIEEGVENRNNRYKSLSNLIRAELKQLGFQFVIPEAQYSSTITSVYLPKGLSYDFLHDKLKESGYIIYAGQGHLKDKIFRVANMGELSRKDIETFLTILKTLVR